MTESEFDTPSNEMYKKAECLKLEDLFSLRLMSTV